MKKALAGFLAAIFAIGATTLAFAGDKEKEKEHKDKDHKEQKK